MVAAALFFSCLCGSVMTTCGLLWGTRCADEKDGLDGLEHSVITFARKPQIISN